MCFKSDYKERERDFLVEGVMHLRQTSIVEKVLFWVDFLVSASGFGIKWCTEMGKVNFYTQNETAKNSVDIGENGKIIKKYLMSNVTLVVNNLIWLK